MGALLDHRPGVVTKGFCTLPHEQEQEDNWQMDQPEEDEFSCDLFTGRLGESPTPMDVPHSTSTPSFCCNKNGEVDDNSQSETPNGALWGAREALQGKDGHVASTPLSSSDINGLVDFKELQALQTTTVDRMPGEGAS